MGFDESIMKTLLEEHLELMQREMDDKLYYGCTTNNVPAEDNVYTEEKMIKAIDEFKKATGYREPPKYARLFSDPLWYMRPPVLRDIKDIT
jgi:peptidoglycan/xylan/chitin deacetylase (PgdA/CDA1 family)